MLVSPTIAIIMSTTSRFGQFLVAAVLAVALFNIVSECQGQLAGSPSLVPVSVKEMSLNQSQQAANSKAKSFHTSYKDPTGKASSLSFAKNDAKAIAKSSSFASSVSEPFVDAVEKSGKAIQESGSSGSGSESEASESESKADSDSSGSSGNETSSDSESDPFDDK